MDLAEDFEIKEEGRIFSFNLKKDISWHDGEEFTAEDVIYTLDIINEQNLNPPLKSNWEGVEYEKINSHKVQFTLPNAYPAFIINTSLPILPEHISLSELEETPIGTGPFRFKSAKTKQGKIKQVTLKQNKNYHLQTPKLKTFTLKAFDGKEDLYTKFENNKINSFSQYAPFDFKPEQKTSIYKALSPQYYAVFFNLQNSDILKEKNFRKGLLKATNKKRLVQEVLNSQAEIVNQAVAHFILGPNQPPSKSQYDPAEAKEILKNYEEATITITTSETPFLKKTTNLLKEDWEKAGVQVKAEFLPPEQLLEKRVKPRDYELLIFGQALSFEPDPLSFWHSRDKEHPGLNLSLYENTRVDTILEQARQEMDTGQRIELYKELNSIIGQDYPAIFLYSPHLLQLTNSNIKGIDLERVNLSKDRLNNVENWYLNEKRIWKKN